MLTCKDKKTQAAFDAITQIACQVHELATGLNARQRKDLGNKLAQYYDQFASNAPDKIKAIVAVRIGDCIAFHQDQP